MMTTWTEGKSAEGIGRLYRDMEVMMHCVPADDEILDDLGDARPPRGNPCSQFQNRVKRAPGWYCATRWPSPASIFQRGRFPLEQ